MMVHHNASWACLHYISFLNLGTVSFAGIIVALTAPAAEETGLLAHLEAACHAPAAAAAAAFVVALAAPLARPCPTPRDVCASTYVQKLETAWERRKRQGTTPQPQAPQQWLWSLTPPWQQHCSPL